MILLLLLAVLVLVLLLAQIRHARTDAAVLDALRSSAATTGEEFFRSLAQHLSRALKADYTSIAEVVPSRAHLRTISAFVDGREVAPIEYEAASMPCERVIATSRFIVQKDLQHTPLDDRFGPERFRSYAGVPLLESTGSPIGVIAIMSRRPLRNASYVEAVLTAMAQRASAELERRRAEHSRLPSEAKTRAILQALPDLMFVFDSDGSYIDHHVAPGAKPYVQESAFMGRRFMEILPPDVVALVEPPFRRVLETGEPVTVEYDLDMPGGTRFYEARMVRIEPGKVLSIVRDVTDTKRAENALKESRYFAQRLVDTVPNVVFVYDLVERRNIFVNRSSESILGYTAAEILEMGDQFLAQMMHPDDLWRLSDVTKTYAQRRDDEVFEHTFRLKHKNGEWRWITRSATVFARATDGRPTQILGSATDVTRLKIAEEELRSLSARLQTAQDEERRRLARELHDGFAQSLFGIGASLATVQRNDGLPGDLKDAVAECERLCTDGLNEIRLLSYVLHPPLLEDLGLVAALKWFAEGFGRRSGIEIELDASEAAERLPSTMERDLFRIAQEGLSNVSQHSGSSKVVVRLDRQVEQAILTIQDFGCGMPTTLASDHRERTEIGVGILAMRERVRNLGGQLEIDSGPQGTILRAVVPCGSPVC